MYRRKDAYYQRAKESGYRSRAAFKLVELAKSERLFRPGDRVVDLGAWPGSWLQVAAPLVGERGRVVGVDLRPVPPLGMRQVEVLVGDVAQPAIEERVWQLCGGPADVVLSDLAPALSGIKARDEAEAARLLEIVLRYCQRGLRRDGTLLCKLFMGSDFPATQAALKAAFERVRILRPDATRKGSAELYALARGKREPATLAGTADTESL